MSKTLQSAHETDTLFRLLQRLGETEMRQRVLMIGEKCLAMTAKILGEWIPRIMPSTVSKVLYTGHFEAPCEDDRATILTLREFVPEVFLFLSTTGTLKNIGTNHRRWVEIVGNLPAIYVFEEEGVMDAIHAVKGIPWRGFHFTQPQDNDQNTLCTELEKLLRRSNKEVGG